MKNLLLIALTVCLVASYRKRDLDEANFCDVCQTIVYRVHDRVKPTIPSKEPLEQRVVDALEHKEVCDPGYLRDAGLRLGHSDKHMATSCGYVFHRLDGSLEEEMFLGITEAELALAVCVEGEELCTTEQIWDQESHFTSLESAPAAEEDAVDWVDFGDIQHLSSNTLQSWLSDDSPQACVLFYAPWCKHCAEFKETYIQASLKEKKENTGITYAAINCESNPEACKQEKILQLPTILFYDSGSEEDPADIDAVTGAGGVIEFTDSIQRVISDRKSKTAAPASTKKGEIKSEL